MFLCFFGWAVATGGRKGDRCGKGGADVSRETPSVPLLRGRKGGHIRPRRGHGEEGEAAKHGRDENKRDEGKKGAAIDGRDKDTREGRPRTAATGTREGDEGRPKTAATRTKGTREREERPSMAATRTRGKGGQGWPRRGHERRGGGWINRWRWSGFGPRRNPCRGSGT